MSASVRERSTQRGQALILMLTVVVMGIAWYTVGVLGKVAPTRAEREVKTGLALQAAKQALLAHAAQYAARSSTSEPGQMPCPESLASIGGANEGQASSSCSNSSATVGRLPWETLGIDQLRDGDGEPLWYVLGPGFRSPPINFGTAGQLTYNAVANSAVAVIIAPGSALNTLSDPATPPPGCSRMNQQVAARHTAALSVANFLECGNATGSYANPGTSQWTNDRAVSITTGEWLDAITPAVADRLQRQVAALIGNWHQIEFDATGRSWGNTYGLNYLPFASSWTNPTTNDYCGDQNAIEGLAPVDPSCYRNSWGNYTESFPFGGGLAVVGGGCSNQGTYVRCRFRRANGTTPLSVQITARTNNVGRAFRSTISVADLTVTGSPISTTMSMSLPNGTSDATVTINVSWPLTLAVGTQVEVDFPHLQDAAVLTDSHYTWFWNNNWHQYTYYAIAASAAPPGNTACTPGVDCVTVNGLPASTGNTNDKRLVLVLSGRALAGQTQPGNNRNNYFESDNRTTGDGSFLSATTSTSFNDRIAACPFHFTDRGGSQVSVCN